MIDPRILNANEPGFGACVFPYFKANFFGSFYQPMKPGSLTDWEGSMYAPKPGSFA